MRGPGTHMGVCDNGSFAGSLSGGCIENAVVAEAIDTLQDGRPRVVRFGSGSPYLDIKLPCGGGLDLHFQPLPDAGLVTECLTAIDARRPFSLKLPTGPDGAHYVPEWSETRYQSGDTIAVIGHWPGPKLLVIGHGAAVPALARLAREMDIPVQALTPDTVLLASLKKDRVHTGFLETPGRTGMIETDRWTAVVFLFHDHDWETALMAHALAQPHFYIGAMGGQRASQMRIAALLQAGCTRDAAASVHAPIGLFHSSRDPDTLALSTLGQVVKTYHETDFAIGAG